MKEFTLVAPLAEDGVILTRGNERILKIPDLKDIRYQFADVDKMVGVAALSAIIESQRPFRVDYTDFETNETCLHLGC